MVVKQKYKRNHWVPQSYLRSFAADAAREKIWRLGKTGREAKSVGYPELKPIEKVAVKFYLYADTKNGERDYSLENKLSDLEQLFGNPFWKKISEDYVDLQDESVRKGVSLLAAVMFLRNPAMLEKTKDLHEKMRSDFLNGDELPDVVEIGGKNTRWIRHRGLPTGTRPKMT
ncbi:DUF4238 domain-containing protein [Shinella sp. JR1-6]|nr:DUF4238 domain-containing protein [Shinella sp. JR1-6]